MICKVALLALAASVPAVAQPPGQLFENVVDTLADDFYDRAFRRDSLPELADRYRAPACDAATRAGERLVVQRLLEDIPVSHLALYSKQTHDHLWDELRGRRAAALGFELAKRGGGYFVATLLEGGPGERVGLRRGDRVLRIDGRRVADSPRLDWRSDDAHLDDGEIHGLLGRLGERVVLVIERQPGELREVVVEVASYSALAAAQESVRVIARDGVRLGYVHFWFIHFKGPAQMLKRLFATDFARCDGLIIDLRGRGGSAAEVHRLLAVLAKWQRPAVALIDSGTRSAKEVIAWEFRHRGLGKLVGVRTAGAVIPATFRRVGDDAVLMFPSATLGAYTDAIEGVGVEPDVAVTAPLRYADGRDPIVAAGVRELTRARPE